MNNLIKQVLLLLSITGVFSPALADSSLSADGAILSNVEVEGILYDVHFGDGVINQAYPLEDITRPAWSDFAASAANAVLDVLGRQFRFLEPADINGCTVSSCELFIPLRPAGSSGSQPDAAYSIATVRKIDGNWRPGAWPQYDANTNTAAVNSVTIMKLFLAGTMIPPQLGGWAISLEEPIVNEVHGGIGNLRGWAIDPEGIEKVEMWLNGAYLFDVPYGGDRPDVGAAYPEVPGSGKSGFSMAFGYSNLAAGEHTMTARAFNSLGEVREASATFSVVTLHKNFIPSSDVVSTDDASCDTSNDEVRLGDVAIDGKLYDLLLKWRTAEQGFEIIEAR